MKKLHISITPAHYKRLEQMQKRVGFPSISRAIEHLIMEDSISQRIDKLIRAIEDNKVHKHDTAGGKKLPSGVFKGSDLYTKYQDPA